MRDIVQEDINQEQQLYRPQWAAFIRAISVFENVKWVNNLISTYKAEIKVLQFKYAGIGVGTVEEIQQKLAQHNLQLSNDDFLKPALGNPYLILHVIKSSTFFLNGCCLDIYS